MSGAVDTPAPDRLEVARTKLAAVLSERDRLVAKHGPLFSDWTRAGAEGPIHNLVDDMIRHALTAYPEIGTAEEAARIFETHEDAYAFEDVPPGVFPIFLLRHLVRVQNVPFACNRSSAFAEFAERYRDIVLV